MEGSNKEIRTGTIKLSDTGSGRLGGLPSGQGCRAVSVPLRAPWCLLINQTRLCACLQITLEPFSQCSFGPTTIIYHSPGPLVLKYMPPIVKMKRRKIFTSLFIHKYPKFWLTLLFLTTSKKTLYVGEELFYGIWNCRLGVRLSIICSFD